MAEINHRVGIAASASDVYQALTTDAGLSRWWTTDTRGAGEVGSVICFRFDGGGPDFEVVELQPDSLVHWKHSGEVPAAWMGTGITFRLDAGEQQTCVRFVHDNWAEATDFMAHCSTKWAVFLLSLKEALETGTGSPFPRDVHIDHD